MANDFALTLALALWGVLLLALVGSVLRGLAHVAQRVTHAYRSRKARKRFDRSLSRFRRSVSNIR